MTISSIALIYVLAGLVIYIFFFLLYLLTEKSENVTEAQKNIARRTASFISFLYTTFLWPHLFYIFLNKRAGDKAIKRCEEEERREEKNLRDD
jgi:hypothetical protein